MKGTTVRSSAQERDSFPPKQEGSPLTHLSALRFRSIRTIVYFQAPKSRTSTQTEYGSRFAIANVTLTRSKKSWIGPNEDAPLLDEEERGCTC